MIQDLNVPIKIDGVPACMPVDTHTVSCSRAVRVVELDLGIGPDVATIDTPHAVEVEGGPGNDRYNAAATDAPSRVTFSGGIGLDTANYFYATAGVDVSLDLEPGRRPPRRRRPHLPRRRGDLRLAASPTSSPAAIARSSYRARTATT